jgi:isopenicillin-N N-acyltransferase-like protein
MRSGARQVGLSAALDLSYERTKAYIKPYVMQEIRGLSDSTNGTLSVRDIRNVMWLGELTRGSCSMFGARDSATRSRGGKLLQLRALDWDVEGPFKNFAAIVVYHPNPGEGHAWANVGFAGFTASVTGFSEAQLGLSEIGVSFPDASFGPETYLAKGYPFGYLIRDVLQFDASLDEATERITGATRTCDLILGVGDGKANDFSGFQYSPHVARVIKPGGLLPVNASWHPPIDDVVYWGMDWICPNDNRMLAHQLNALHGNLTAENTISDVVSYVGTGDLHIAVYDHAARLMYVATARPDGGAGPVNAYQRQFTRLDMAALFAEKPPAAAAA